MTNREVLDNVFKLDRLLKKGGLTFPADISYKIIRNYHMLHELELSIDQAKEQLISQMYEPVEGEPGTFQPKEGFREQAQKNLEALYNVKNIVDLQTFSSRQIAHMNLSLEDMDAIYFMIKED